MRHIALGGLIVAALAVAIVACNNNNNVSGTSPGVGQITGTVIDGTAQTPLAGVTVTATDLAGDVKSMTTGTDGQYTFTFTIDSTSSAVVSFHITGWRDTTVVFPLKSGSPTLGNVVMARKSQILGGGTTSGLAQTIAFIGANPTSISVKGVGALETSLLTWEVRDSLGLPVDASHSITLTFTIANGPGGGEYLSPTSVPTNSTGQAFMTLSAGVRAGIVQIVATGIVQTPNGPQTVTTQPVKVVIAGGFPDQAHFTLSATIYNLPILALAGAREHVGVLVGDKYSNPVAQATAVYFRSTAGVIQPKVFTDPDGLGSVDLISGNPYPFGQYAAPQVGTRPFGDGYEYIAANTAGQGGVTVGDSILVLWSGTSNITNFNPTTFNIANGGFQVFTFNVADYLGHPLAAGTIIAVSATVPPPPDPTTPVNQVQLAFGLNGSYVLSDVLVPGPGNTQFTCTLSDGTTNINDVLGTAVTLTVQVTGPNGQATYTINGLVH